MGVIIAQAFLFLAGMVFAAVAGMAIEKDEGKTALVAALICLTFGAALIFLGVTQ